jgi:type I restriction-modification system DNA methylase subunit
MSTLGATSFAIETVSRVWNVKPYQNVRIPDFQRGKTPVVADALWTDYELRPSANNLAFLVQSVSNNSEYMVWSKRLKQWPIRGGLLISPDEIQLFHPLGVSGELASSIVERDSLATELQGSKSHLFSPKKLAQYRVGQLSLADLEDSITRNSFSFLERQRSQLDKAFQDAIKSSLQVVRRVDSGNSKTLEGHVIRVAIAYLAARILEDKHFFESNIPTNDARKLLRATVSKTNGFFKRAFDQSIPYLEEFSPDCVDEVLQQLALYLGGRVSFSLVDHRDVGRLYEKAIKELPNSEDLDLKDKDLTDLQRHYTPVAIAERMLEMLPLERLRPEERVIFDPAAGSGSFLLAATSRLAGMSDLPDDRGQYLASHVIGNDIDPYANLVTNLRYILASESLGKDAIFPAPNDFHCSDYNLLNIHRLQHKPKVLVANPPFSEDVNKQIAVEFIKTAFKWMDEGSQFAFVMPQTFLKGTTHGFDEVRNLMSEQCQILEVCQLPERAIGVEAEHATCIVSGILGENHKKNFSLARAVFTREKSAFEHIREYAFLGTAWIAKLEQDTAFWRSTTSPSIRLSIPTIALGNLFFIFNGVTHKKEFPPVSDCLQHLKYKPTWRMKWKSNSRIWASSNNLSSKMYVAYEDTRLHRMVKDCEHLFDLPKLLIGRIQNIGMACLSAQIDTEGLCPNNSVWCVLPVEQAQRMNKGYSAETLPNEWSSLSIEEKNLWLLGILISDLGSALSLSGRGNVNLTEDIICKLPLPLTIDWQIIYIVNQILQRDRENNPLSDDDYESFKLELNYLVEKSYGNPSWIRIKRTGIPPELEEWTSEQSKPTWSVSGQVIEVCSNTQQVKLHLTGLSSDRQEEWIPLPQEFPGWALDGTVFEAQLSQDVETFEQLAQRPWALRHFRHTPRPYLTDEELSDLLEWEEDE